MKKRVNKRSAEEQKREQKTGSFLTNSPKQGQVKGFVWYSLRISFLLMFLFFIISLSLPLFLTSLVNLLFIISLLFTFVVSIIHLFKQKKKAFAIVALVISVLFILF